MIENTPFNDEWNKLQKTFWDNVGSDFVDLSHQALEEHNTSRPQQTSLFDQWLTDVDKCWQDHAQVNSDDIDSLYKRISSSSRFFFNFTGSVISTKQGETADVLVTKYLKGFANKNFEKDTNIKNNNKNSTEENDTASHQKNNTFDINSFWKLPLENWQQQTAYFSNQQSLNTLFSLMGDGVNDPEFSAALEAYLIALQKYQLFFCNLFTAAAKQAVETLKSNSDKPASPKLIMTIWLEVLEANYMLLISEDNYSQAYADVVNSWMLMLSKLNKPFAEFVQANMSSPQSTKNDQH